MSLLDAILPLQPDAGMYVAISIITILYINYVRKNTDKEKLQKITTVQLFVVAYSAIIFYSAFIHPETLIFSDVNQAYYADLALTTPLTIYILSLTATGEFRKKAKISAGLHVATVIVWYHTLSSSDPEGLFWLGSVLFLTSVYYLIQIEDVLDYSALTALTIITWFVYPIVWFETGGDLVQMKSLLVLIPLLANHVFSILTVRQIRL